MPAGAAEDFVAKCREHKLDFVRFVRHASSAPRLRYTATISSLGVRKATTGTSAPKSADSTATRREPRGNHGEELYQTTLP